MDAVSANTRHPRRGTLRRPLNRVIPLLLVLGVCLPSWVPSGLWWWLPLLTATVSGLVVMVVWRRDSWIAKEIFKDPVVLGASFLAGLAIVQYLNTDGMYLENGYRWWISEVPHVKWLPSGVAAALGEAGPAAWLVRFLAAVAAYSAGKSLATSSNAGSRVLWILLVCLTAWATFGSLQRLSGTTRIYGYWVPPLDYFFGPMVYKNHAAAYLTLAMAACAAVLILCFRSQNRDRSGLLFFCTFCLACVLCGLLLSGTALGLAVGGLTGIAGCVVFWYWLAKRLRGPLALLLGAIVVVVLAAVVWLSSPEIKRRVTQWENGDARYSWEAREAARNAGWKMHLARPWLGWGAGCFTYRFPPFQAEEPLAAKWNGFNLRWEHVHNDWLELLIEFGWLGVAGAAVIASTLIYRTVQALERRDWVPFCLFAGVWTLGAFAALDFPTANTAVFSTGALLAGVAVVRTQSKQSPDLARDLPRVPSPERNLHPSSVRRAESQRKSG